MPPLDPFPFVLGGWPFNGKLKEYISIVNFTNYFSVFKFIENIRYYSTTPNSIMTLLSVYYLHSNK